MDNMRGFTVAIYPETRKELEIIKNENNFTWDELFNYLMKVEKLEKQKQEAQKGLTLMTKENKELIGCFLAGGVMSLVFLWWMLAPLIQF